MLPQEIDSQVFALPLGDISKPVASQFGYHLLRVDEKRIASKLRYEQVREDLEQLLAQANFGKELAEYLKGLRKEAKIQIFTASQGKTKSNP
jgi:peptidyl-prolyl cis-trans isomerase C